MVNKKFVSGALDKTPHKRFACVYLCYCPHSGNRCKSSFNCVSFHFVTAPSLDTLFFSVKLWFFVEQPAQVLSLASLLFYPHKRTIKIVQKIVWHYPVSHLLLLAIKIVQATRAQKVNKSLTFEQPPQLVYILPCRIDYLRPCHFTRPRCRSVTTVTTFVVVTVNKGKSSIASKNVYHGKTISERLRSFLVIAVSENPPPKHSGQLSHPSD